MPEYSEYKKMNKRNNTLHNIIIVNHFLRKTEKLLKSEQKFCKIETKKTKKEVLKIISNLIPLPVIASFSTNGKMIPIYVQFFPGERPIRVSAKCIANAVTYAEYICEYMLEDDENIHSVNLIYQKDKQIWGARVTR